MIKRIETTVLQWMEGEERSLTLNATRKLLEWCSYGYSTAIKARNFLYDKQILKSRRCSVPVISIGNILAGGTGKTPFTALLAEELSKNFRIGILLRGYRAEFDEKEARVVCEGKGPILLASQSGDEGYLIAKKVPQSIVVVGKDRFSAAQIAIEKGAQLLLMDDGLQHRKLHRDLEIVLVQPERPFGNGYFLPRGLLRDQPSRLNKADYFAAVGSAMKDKKPTIVCRIVPSGICFWGKEELVEIEQFEYKRVATFCAIARPQRFIETVKGLGKEIVDSLFLADHEKISVEKLKRFSEEAKKKGAEAILCTEKDFVKLEGEKLPIDLVLPTASLNISWEIVAESEWQQLLKTIRKLIG